MYLVFVFVTSDAEDGVNLSPKIKIIDPYKDSPAILSSVCLSIHTSIPLHPPPFLRVTPPPSPTITNVSQWTFLQISVMVSLEYIPGVELLIVVHACEVLLRNVRIISF